MSTLTVQDALLPGKTSGFNIIFLGTTVAFRSRAQATKALSSAESELYAICTGVNEGLHLRNFLLETNICSKLNLRVHADSTAGKSIATRQGTSKRAKHIDKFLYTQDLIKHNIIRILKINTLHNSADLFTKYISYTGSSRALGYAFSTTNDVHSCFTTTTTPNFLHVPASCFMTLLV